MKRREFLQSAGLSAAAACGWNSGASATPRSSESLPNIVYILADDLGYGDISYLNPDSRIRTPNIDRLGREGMAFTDMHSGSAVCTPTRYGIMTGRYSWRTRLAQGVLFVRDTPLITRDRLTVAQLLQRKGYYTACVGKWHLGLGWATTDGAAPGKDNIDFGKPYSDGPLDHGFDYYFGIPGSLDMEPYMYLENRQALAPPTEPVAEGKGLQYARGGLAAPGFKREEVLPNLAKKAVECIETHAKNRSNQPLFLYFPLSSPHAPILPTAEFRGKTPVGDYGDFVCESDWAVGQVMAALEKNGMARNTLFVMTSDNGCSTAARIDDLQDHGHYPSYHFRGWKTELYEGGHHIPFLVRWPAKVAAQSQCAHMAGLWDWMATMADLTGQHLPDTAGEDSVSFLPALLGKAHKPARDSLVHHSSGGYFAIRENEWKLLLCSGSGSGRPPKPDAEHPVPPVQLYNLHEDAGERWNLEAKHPEIVHALTQRMQRYIDAGRSTPGRRQKNDREVSIYGVEQRTS